MNFMTTKAQNDEWLSSSRTLEWIKNIESAKKSKIMVFQMMIFEWLLIEVV